MATNPNKVDRKRCCLDYCKRFASQNDGVSLHIFPQDPVQRSEWVKFVHVNSPQVQLCDSSRLCSEHFQSSCATSNKLQQGFNIPVLRRHLKKGSIPSIRGKRNDKQDLEPESESESEPEPESTISPCTSPRAKRSKQEEPNVSLLVHIINHSIIRFGCHTIVANVFLFFFNPLTSVNVSCVKKIYYKKI